MTTELQDNTLTRAPDPIARDLHYTVICRLNRKALFTCRTGSRSGPRTPYAPHLRCYTHFSPNLSASSDTENEMHSTPLQLLPNPLGLTDSSITVHTHFLKVVESQGISSHLQGIFDNFPLHNQSIANVYLSLVLHRAAVET